MAPLVIALICLFVVGIITLVASEEKELSIGILMGIFLLMADGIGWILVAIMAFGCVVSGI